MNNLLLPTRLNNAVTAALYALVLLGVVLNIFGYDYYMKDGHFVSDTLENRQFENEVRRSGSSFRKLSDFIRPIARFVT